MQKDDILFLMQRAKAEMAKPYNPSEGPPPSIQISPAQLYMLSKTAANSEKYLNQLVSFTQRMASPGICIKNIDYKELYEKAERKLDSFVQLFGRIYWRRKNGQITE